LILVDTSAVLQLASPSGSRHEDVLGVVDALDGPFLLSPFVLAELDYMLVERLGQERQLALLAQVVDGSYELAEFGRHDVEAAVDVMNRYADLRVGLADASIVVLAEKHSTPDVLTFDHRHFRAMRGPGGRPFRLLPDDLPV
jgi:predicted nucleic acid-binding protein